MVSPGKKAEEVCNSIYDNKKDVEECKARLRENYAEFQESRHENPIDYNALPEPVAETVGAGFTVDYYDEEWAK